MTIAEQIHAEIRRAAKDGVIRAELANSLDTHLAGYLAGLQKAEQIAKKAA